MYKRVRLHVTVKGVKLVFFVTVKSQMLKLGDYFAITCVSFSSLGELMPLHLFIGSFTIRMFPRNGNLRIVNESD